MFKVILSILISHLFQNWQLMQLHRFPGGAHKANGVNGLLYSARDLSSQQILSLKLDEMSINSACMIRILKEQG